MDPLYIILEKRSLLNFHCLNSFLSRTTIYNGFLKDAFFSLWLTMCDQKPDFLSVCIV